MGQKEVVWPGGCRHCWQLGSPVCVGGGVLALWPPAPWSGGQQGVCLAQAGAAQFSGTLMEDVFGSWQAPPIHHNHPGTFSLQDTRSQFSSKVLVLYS